MQFYIVHIILTQSTWTCQSNPLVAYVFHKPKVKIQTMSNPMATPNRNRYSSPSPSTFPATVMRETLSLLGIATIKNYSIILVYNKARVRIYLYILANQQKKKTLSIHLYVKIYLTNDNTRISTKPAVPWIYCILCVW